MSRCLICQKKENRIVFQDHQANILRCNYCGHLFSDYRAKKHYDNYYGQKIDTTSKAIYWLNQAHAAMYEEFGQRFLKDKKGKIIDVGCGMGFFLKSIQKYRGWETYGYEISRPAVEYALNTLKLRNIYPGQVEQSHFKENFFDIVTLWDVIEHLKEPDPFLKYLNSVLKPGGLLFIHTPNASFQLLKARLKKIFYGMDEKKHYLEAKDHLHIYKLDTLKKLLERNGFKDVRFTHLKPIQSLAGRRDKISTSIKNNWFNFTVILSKISQGKVNFDNLFVIARK